MTAPYMTYLKKHQEGDSMATTYNNLFLDARAKLRKAGVESAQLEAREQAQLLREALNELGELDREILVRHYYFYQRVSEIARLLGLNENTVKSRLLRGRKALQKKLEERGIDRIEAV